MLLDIDKTLLEKRLLLQEDAESEDALSVLRTTAPSDAEAELSWKTIIPTPGKCYKYKDEEKGKKYFLNLCYSDVIPAPDEISEEELGNLIYSNKIDSFRLPLSSGDVHEEKDKSGNPCEVFDIAVNTQLFAKISTEPLFSMFFLHVACTVLEEKYGHTFESNSWIPLHNRRCWGKIKEHRIKYRDVKPLVKELPQVERIEKEERESKIQPLITEVSTTVRKHVDKIEHRFALEEKHGERFLKVVFTVGRKVEETKVEAGQSSIRVSNPSFPCPLTIDISQIASLNPWKMTSDNFAVANTETQVKRKPAYCEKGVMSGFDTVVFFLLF